MSAERERWLASGPRTRDKTVLSWIITDSPQRYYTSIRCYPGKCNVGEALSDPKRILVTGAAGKVGQAFIASLLEPSTSASTIRGAGAVPQPQARAGARLEVVSGSIEHRAVVDRRWRASRTCCTWRPARRRPRRSWTWPSRACSGCSRRAARARRFGSSSLIGGDAGMGHFFYPHPVPVTETQKHRAYPGCYALSKVLEEVMLEQYYDPVRSERLLPARAVDHGEGRLQVPALVRRGRVRRAALARSGRRRSRPTTTSRAGAVPVMLDPDGEPVKRNFVHVDDLVDAILAALDHPQARQQTFNICMDEPVDYGELGAYLTETRGLPTRRRSARRITRPGSTTPRPSSCSAGARATT